MTGFFVDSNIVIFAYGDDLRTDLAKSLLLDAPTISVQVLNEFTNVARRKLKLDWAQIGNAIDDIVTLCPRILDLTADLHVAARILAQRYRFTFYDALIVAAALDAECDTLFSEDMHDGLVIEGRLTVRNPFKS